MPRSDTGTPGAPADAVTANRKVIEQFRAGGPIEGMHRDRLVLLSTVGRKTGKRHTTPMMFNRDGDRVLVMASNAGALKHPQWYLNLEANPRVTVEVGDERYEAVATPAAGQERDRLWATIKRNYPFFGEHEARAGRTIPVVVLTKQKPR